MNKETIYGAKEALKNDDAYTFFNVAKETQSLVMAGPTGTNIANNCRMLRSNSRHVVYTSRQNEFFNFHAVTSSNSPDIGGGDRFLDVVDQVRSDEEEESE